MKRFVLFIIISLFSISAFSQALSDDDLRAAKRESRKNMTIKEWNTDASSKVRWLDRKTTYDSKGRKIEEVEYARYGQKWRETYEYDDKDRIVKCVYYNDRNKPELIRKYEYNAKGQKVKQLNYSPGGKLITVKVFEYITSE